MRNRSMTIWMATAVLVMATGQGFGGVVYYNDGGTHNISTTINDNVWVDYQAPGMQTTVNMLAGGSLPDTHLRGFNNSRLNILGGSMYDLYAHDSTQVTMSSGWMNYSLWACDSTQVTISGGSVGSWLFALGNSQVTMTGGLMHNHLCSQDSSQVTMSGGSARYLEASGNGQITMTGGSVGSYLEALGNSQVTMSGGTVGEDLRLDNLAALIINGSDFAIDGNPVALGEISSILGGSLWDEPFRQLTGTLANGDMLDNQFRIGEDASIVLVPEPATLLLLGLGVPILSRLRTKH